MKKYFYKKFCVATFFFAKNVATHATPPPLLLLLSGDLFFQTLAL
jgi:hypothetical protein